MPREPNTGLALRGARPFKEKFIKAGTCQRFFHLPSFRDASLRGSLPAD